MTYLELYERANRMLDRNEINLGEYEKMIKPLEAEVSRWIPCSERVPDEDGYYLVTNSKWGAPWREITLWMTDGWSSDNKPIAWMPLPEPWKGENHESLCDY